MQVDVTTRMGALTPATPTGLPSLDRLLFGGVRAGTLMVVAGGPGMGRTAFSLLLAYIAARSKAAVVFTSASLDETEIMARLAARALHREWPESSTPYGLIWSGQAWQRDETRLPVGSAVETVVKKVGNLLHLHRPSPYASTGELESCVGELWGRHERVVMVVDDIEAFSAKVRGDAGATASMNSSFGNRLAHVAYDLRRIAQAGCAVVVTVQSEHLHLVSPAATLSAELKHVEHAGSPASQRSLALGAHPMDLLVNKNRLGPTGVVPLRFIPGAGIFEERAP